MVDGDASAGFRASLMSGSRMDSSVMFSGAEEPPVLRGCPGCPMMFGTRSASQQEDMYFSAYWTATHVVIQFTDNLGDQHKTSYKREWQSLFILGWLLIQMVKGHTAALEDSRVHATHLLSHPCCAATLPQSEQRPAILNYASQAASSLGA